MEVVYLRQALKDVNKIKNDKLKSKIFQVVTDLKMAENLSEIKNVKPMSGHSDAYRIRIGNYRLGVFYSEETITIARFVKREDIIRLEANGNYTAFYLKDKTKYLITRTLKYYDEMLRDYGFYRIHKSHLVNLVYVTKFIKGRQGYVETINGDRLEVSTRKREELCCKLELSLSMKKAATF